VTVSVTASASAPHTYFAAPNDITVRFTGGTATADLVPGVAQAVRFSWSALIQIGPYGVHPDPGAYHCASGFDETHTFDYTVTANGVSGTMSQPVRIRWICNDQGQIDVAAAGPLTLDLGDGQHLEVRQLATASQFLACTASSQSCAGGGGQLLVLQMVIAAPQNTAPTASAGPDQLVSLGDSPVEVTLDGSASADADGDALTYTWSGDFEGGTASGASPKVRFATMGAHDVTLTVSDGALSSTDHVIVTVRDGSPPVITYQVTPASPGGAGGWYTGNVSLTWSVVDPQDPAGITRTGCADQSITADQPMTSYACSATSAGGTATPVTVTIGRDALAPAIAAALSPASPDGQAGWYVTAPTISWSCTDATSGVATCSSPTTLSERATAQQVTGTATDRAGHASTASVAGLLVDLLDPTVSCGAAPVFLVGASGVVSATVQDQASGPVASSVSAPANTSSPGARTAILTGRDRAGRSTTVACPYSVQYQFDGFFSPVSNDRPNTLRAGQTLPIKWRLTGAGGAPVLDLAAATLSVADSRCALGSTADLPREDTAGSSGLQNLGDGYYQLNWQTPRGYSRSCKTVRLTLGDGVAHTFSVEFTR
jgi:PKD repeat protein